MPSPLLLNRLALNSQSSSLSLWSPGVIGMDYHAQALGVFQCKKVGCMPTAGTYSSPCYSTPVRSQKHLSKKKYSMVSSRHHREPVHL